MENRYWSWFVKCQISRIRIPNSNRITNNSLPQCSCGLPGDQSCSHVLLLACDLYLRLAYTLLALLSTGWRKCVHSHLSSSFSWDPHFQIWVTWVIQLPHPETERNISFVALFPHNRANACRHTWRLRLCSCKNYVVSGSFWAADFLCLRVFRSIPLV